MRCLTSTGNAVLIEEFELKNGQFYVKVLDSIGDVESIEFHVWLDLNNVTILIKEGINWVDAKDKYHEIRIDVKK